LPGGTIAAAHGVLRGVKALHLGYTLAARSRPQTCPADDVSLENLEK